MLYCGVFFVSKKLKQVKFLTYKQLVQNLRRRNLTISNEQLAIELLKARGYYTLVNRYKEHVYNHNKKYTDNVITTQEFKHEFGKNDLFAFMLSLILTLDRFDSLNLLYQLKSWERNNLSSKNRADSLQLFLKGLKLPIDFLDRLENMQTKITKQQNQCQTSLTIF